MIRFICIIPIFILLFGCRGSESTEAVYQQSDTPDERIFSLPEVELDEVLEQAGQIPLLTSFLMFQGDEIVAEKYNGNMNRNRPTNIKSASKNVISALVGLAVQHGYIESIHDPVAAYLPVYFEAYSEDSSKHDITIAHLLTMSSGLQSTSFRNYGRWVASRNWVAAALNGELFHDPGTRMRYSTGDTHILSAIITEASGMNTRQFAERYLFEPLGVRIGGWDREPAGYFFGGNNMALSPAGMLAFGRLFLQNGNWDGRQIIEPEWVRESLKVRFQNTSFNYRGHDYGYLWWRNTFAEHEAWFAWGYGGQYMFMLPELDAIVVITCSPDNRTRGLNNQIYDLMDSHIVPWLYHREKQASQKHTEIIPENM